MVNLDNRPLYEKYRPAAFCDVVGQGKVVAQLQRMEATTGLAGRAYWLSGQSGTGKSTLARLIAASVADPIFTQELDAQWLTPPRLAEIEAESRYSAWGKGGKAYIVNEAHTLSDKAIAALLTLLERLPAHVAFIFTTTIEGEQKTLISSDDATPLLSRCLRLDLARRDLADAFALRAQTIAKAEGLDGRPIGDYKRLVQKHRQNLRAVLQEIEAGAMLLKE